ncbi:MAG: SUMF1/EgtB/PvdO family nonheme iron enzyme [Planctomycetaceae bacterium]|jgi:formylglycine-generating enzyme required for sulfatase activity
MIFLNYRIKDTNDELNRLQEWLEEEFGVGTNEAPIIFRDRSNLQGSQDWPESLRQAVSKCEVLLVAIGPQWEKVCFPAAHENEDMPRLKDPADWVRQEIALAHELGKPIIPVLLNGARPPKKWFLKDVGLECLEIRQAIPVEGDLYGLKVPVLSETICQLAPRMKAFREAQVALRESKGKTAATVPRSIAPLPREYLRNLQNAIASIELLGLRLQKGQSVTLNSVYVPLTTTPQPAAPSDMVAMEDCESQLEKSGDHRLPTLLLTLLNHQSLYVSGPAGSGKSTFCRWVAWLACAGTLPEVPVTPPEGYAEKFPESFRCRLPVLVPLRAFWHHLPKHPGCDQFSQFELEQSLGEWVEKTRPHGLERTVFESHLKQGMVLLILDGVDEVPMNDGAQGHPAPMRRPLIAGLGPACVRWIAANNRVLITSRPYGLSHAEVSQLGLPAVPIADLDPTLQWLLVQRWFRCLEVDSGMAERQAGGMLRHIEDRVDLLELIPNPMLLTAICVLHHQGRRLPRDRHELYDQIVDYVLHNRYANETEKIFGVRFRLGFIAGGMHTGEKLGDHRILPQAQITEAEVDKLLAASRNLVQFTDATVQEVAKLREDLLTKSGLFLPQGDKQAGFYHLTVQDFFAAERLFEQDEPGLKHLFQTRGNQPAWRSTIQFLSGALAKRPARLLSLLGQLCCELPDDAWNLALVIWDAVQIAQAREITVPMEVRERLVATALNAIEREATLAQRHELGLSLGHLGDPRVPKDVRTKEGFVKVPAGDYTVGEKDKRVSFTLQTDIHVSKYLVTNSQFALFVADGGYQDANRKKSRWWTLSGKNWLQDCVGPRPFWGHDTYWNAPNQPVVGASYYEAEAFANWAGCRLPTADESEAAARGWHGWKYPWGNEWTDGICNSREAGLRQTSAVGLFPSSRSHDFGLEDCAGNVWEWCADRGKNDEWRVIRGGCWATVADRVRCSLRGHDPAQARGDYLGFRLVKNDDS